MSFLARERSNHKKCKYDVLSLTERQKQMILAGGLICYTRQQG